MDFEVRNLYRHYKAHPTWESAYQLLRKNQKLSGELISEDNLRHFARANLFPPFFRAIERLHSSAYAGAQQPEWDFYDDLQYNAKLIDNESAAYEGLIPEIEVRPFTYIVTLILQDDVMYGNQGIDTYYPGFYAGSRADSIAFNRRVDSGLESTLSSLTLEEFRRSLRRKYNYPEDYIYGVDGNPWGYLGMLTIPKGEWDPQTATSRNHLFIIYTFSPDEILWDLLLQLELGT